MSQVIVEDNVLEEIVSTQCVNYRRCGGNVTFIPGRASGRSPEPGAGPVARVEIIGHTCACSYSDGDLAWFAAEAGQGRSHP